MACQRHAESEHSSPWGLVALSGYSIDVPSPVSDGQAPCPGEALALESWVPGHAVEWLGGQTSASQHAATARLLGTACSQRTQPLSSCPHH